MHSAKDIQRKVSSIIKKLMINQIGDDLPTDDDQKEEPRLARKGYVAMYVGEEGKRYEVPIKYLSIPKFKELIMESEAEDPDSKINGPIKLLCSTAFFDQLLKLAEKA